MAFPVLIPGIYGNIAEEIALDPLSECCSLGFCERRRFDAARDAFCPPTPLHADVCTLCKICLECTVFLNLSAARTDSAEILLRGEISRSKLKTNSNFTVKYDTTYTYMILKYRTWIRDSDLVA